MLHVVAVQKLTDVSEVLTASIIKAIRTLMIETAWYSIPQDIMV
jgi:hypothetical protein